MTREFDLIQGLTTGVADRSAAWQFIRGFAESWSVPLVGGDGWDDEELASAEQRLGVPLPVALREAHQLLGRRSDLTSNHDVLLRPDQLYLGDGQEALVFRHENQGAASWGVLVAELGATDPAVVVRGDLADKQAEKWDSWLPRLSLTFLEIVLSESLNCPEGLYDLLDELDDEHVDLLEQHYTRLPLPEYPIGQDGLGSRWFAGPDVLLREDGRAVLSVRARTEPALDQVRDRFPGCWINY